MGGMSRGEKYYQGLYQQGQSQLDTLLGKAPTQTPSFSDPNVQAARESQVLTAKLARGRKSTFIDSSQNLLDPGAVSDKQLLGG